MVVELDGNVRMRGDTGPGVRVRILAEGDRLRLLAGYELVGDWKLPEIGVIALHDGFNIKAEGEEFVLRTDDDVALAEEIGIAAASPRLARRLAARHNPEEPVAASEPPLVSSHLAAVAFAIAGALVVFGGAILDVAGGTERPATADTAERFWWPFVLGGVFMIAAAFVMSVGTRWGRIGALVVLAGMIVLFGFAVTEPLAGTAQMTALGLVAGGLVVGVAVLSSGSLRQPD